jgi:hypothetical protein
VSRAGLAEAIRTFTTTQQGPPEVAAPAGRWGLVEMFDGPAALLYEVDETEVARRGGHGLGALDRLDVLDVLMSLPRDLAVPWTDLALADCGLLSDLPPGVVDRSGTGVVRRLSAPLEPRLALVAAPDWRSGVKKAGRFAPYCSRSVVLRHGLAGDELAEANLRASFFGVGLCVLRDDELHTVCEPKPYARRRHTPAQWWFAEDAWGQIGGVVTGPGRV